MQDECCPLIISSVSAEQINEIRALSFGEQGICRLDAVYFTS